jgi:hypothetical protein
MSLIVCNLTSSAVPLVKGNRTVIVPAKVGSLTYGPPVNVTSALQGLIAGDYTALESQRSGAVAYFWSDGVPLFAVGTLTVGTNVSGVTVQTTVATVSALVQARKVEFPATTKAAELISVVNAVLPSNVALTLALQPDVARKLQVRIVTGSTAGTLTLVGVDQNGNAATQAFDISTSGGTRTVITDKAYATLTSATISGGSGFDGTVGIGLASALGLPANKSPAATAFAVYKAQVNGLNETVGTVDATAGTIIPTTAPDAAHSYAFWYNFTVTPTSPTHTHTLA